MEDEMRPLPEGWVRSFDPKTNHQFFVDTSKEPPRSIWHHPYDDDEYMGSLPEKERQRILEEQRNAKAKKSEDADEKDAGSGEHLRPHADGGASASSTSLGSSAAPTGLHKFGRKLKDKVTGSTHAEREARRAREAAEEEEAYKLHLAYREAMNRAVQTGEPQFLGKDRQGKDVYIEPPNGPAAPPGAYGYNPYANGPYTDPNARFIRPDYPYNRPYGSGYGGGYGLPLAGGLLGGALLGSLLFTPF